MTFPRKFQASLKDATPMPLQQQSGLQYPGEGLKLEARL